MRPLNVAIKGGHVDMAEALLEHDAEADAVDTLARGPLHTAAELANADCVSLLLRSRADALRRDPEGKVPIEVVPEGLPGSERVVALLTAYTRCSAADAEAAAASQSRTL